MSSMSSKGCSNASEMSISAFASFERDGFSAGLSLSTLWFGDQRGTHQLFARPGVDASVCISGCCPRAIAVPSRGRIQHASAADLLVTLRREASADEFTAIVIEQGRIAVGSDMN